MKNQKLFPTVKNQKYDLDKNIFVNENSVEYLKTVKANSCDFLVTDPPYWLPVQHSAGIKTSPRTAADDMVLVTFFKEIFLEINRITTADSAWYVFCDSRSYPIFYQVVRSFVKDVRIIVWEKPNARLGYTWRHKHELIMFATKPDYKGIPTGDSDVIKCKVVPVDERIHQAQKPVELLEKIISKHGKFKTVLDPFAGSGTTGIAAINTKNYYHLVEMEENYYTKAKLRILADVKQSKL